MKHFLYLHRLRFKDVHHGVKTKEFTRLQFGLTPFLKLDMETLNDFATVFGNGFFPIIVSAVMFYILAKQLTELKKAITENTAKLTELITLFKTIQ